jgi:RNA ligase (TIGR02306 family)
MTEERRNLVTIRTISDIQPIPGADAIDVATVDGWKVVVKKGDFIVGDRAFYFEIDSFLPVENPRFDFLMKNKITWNGHEGARLRTIRLRGQISQGLLLPLEDIDGDLTEAMGVLKYEAPIPANLSGEVAGGFPGFIRKTDQLRIQNTPNVITENADHLFEVTVKLDGTSMTVFYKEGVTGVCGRNFLFKDETDNTLNRTARSSGLLDYLSEYGSKIGNLAFQGELVGPGIQGNKEKLLEPEFRVFDIWDIDNHRYLKPLDRMTILNHANNYGATVKHVPILEQVLSLNIFNGIEDILKFAEGPSMNKSTEREGLVFKRLDGAFSFKAISNKWLLKNE